MKCMILIAVLAVMAAAVIWGFKNYYETAFIWLSKEFRNIKGADRK